MVGYSIIGGMKQSVRLRTVDAYPENDISFDITTFELALRLQTYSK